MAYAFRQTCRIQSAGGHVMQVKNYDELCLTCEKRAGAHYRFGACPENGRCPSWLAIGPRPAGAPPGAHVWAPSGIFWPDKLPNFAPFKGVDRVPAPAAPAPPEAWRAFQHNLPGECPCGTSRAVCEYHR